MTPLDRYLQTNAATRVEELRTEAGELRKQAVAVEARANILVRTWDLCRSCIRPLAICSGDPCDPCVACDRAEHDHPNVDCGRFDNEDK